MKQAIKLGLVASALMAITGTVSAQMKDITVVDTKESPYVIDARGVIVRDPFGLCWRTGSWSADRAAKTVIKDAKYPNWTAICECEAESLWTTMPPVCLPPPPPPPPPAAPPPPPPPPAAPAPTSEKVTFAADALFDFDKAVLRPEGKAKLDDLVSKMAGVSLEVIIGVGYTDRLGPMKHNMDLSVRRSQAVKDYLVSKGIEPNRIYTEGKGPANPVKQCADPSTKGEIRTRQQLIDCLQPNRRVEVEVVGTRPVKR
jgi:OOP family OmpA-OmpF porin